MEVGFLLRSYFSFHAIGFFFFFLLVNRGKQVSYYVFSFLHIVRFANMYVYFSRSSSINFRLLSKSSLSKRRRERFSPRSVLLSLSFSSPSPTLLARGWQAAGRRLKLWFHARLHGSKVIAFKCGTIVAYASGAPTCDQRLKNNRIRRVCNVSIAPSSSASSSRCPTTSCDGRLPIDRRRRDSQSLSLFFLRILFESLNVDSVVDFLEFFEREKGRGSRCPHFPNAWGPMDRES